MADARGLQELDVKAKNLRDTTSHLQEIHAKTLKAAKSMAVLGEDTLKLAQSLTDYANYLNHSNDESDANLRKALLSVAEFFRYQESMRVELNTRLAEYFSGPINNFINMEVREALDLRRKVDNNLSSYEGINSKVRKMQSKSKTDVPKVLEEQRNQSSAREEFEKTFHTAQNRLHEVTQHTRIYFPEKLTEFLEFQRDFMWQNFTHIDAQSDLLTGVIFQTQKAKEDLRQTNPGGVGSSLQGSSVTYSGGVSRPAKRLVDLEKLRQMRLDEDAQIQGITTKVREVETQLEAPSDVVVALQQLQSQVSSLSLDPAPLARSVSAGIPLVQLPLCTGCGQPIKEQGLTALEKQWHPLCFVCGCCRRPFGNAPFFIHEGVPYCETDYARVLGNAPGAMTCPGCNQLITGPYIKAMNRFWHPGHFICSVCQGGLQGGFWELNGRPFCTGCTPKTQETAPQTQPQPTS